MLFIFLNIKTSMNKTNSMSQFSFSLNKKKVLLPKMQLDHNYKFLDNKKGTVELHYSGKYCSTNRKKTKEKVIKSLEMLGARVCIKAVKFDDILIKRNSYISIGIEVNNSDAILFLRDGVDLLILVFENQISYKQQIFNSFKYSIAHRQVPDRYSNKTILIENYYYTD